VIATKLIGGKEMSIYRGRKRGRSKTAHSSSTSKAAFDSNTLKRFRQSISLLVRQTVSRLFTVIYKAVTSFLVVLRIFSVQKWKEFHVSLG